MPGTDAGRLADRVLARATGTLTPGAWGEDVTWQDLFRVGGRLLATTVPETLATGFFKRVRNERPGRIAITDAFSDYWYGRDPALLEDFAMIAAGRHADREAAAVAMLETISEAMAEGRRPSDYLAARAAVSACATRLGVPALAESLTGLIAIGWRRAGPGDGFDARLGFDFFRTLDCELDKPEHPAAATVLAGLVDRRRLLTERVAIQLRRLTSSGGDLVAPIARLIHSLADRTRPAGWAELIRVVPKGDSELLLSVLALVSEPVTAGVATAHGVA
ncbi:hypothetical protein FPZ12_045340 [Amycolatopsis acidicola]|uniref:Uncharacterized protein n=1 Tax=Amycolatopsis acidicola TaxID=2596893 RepID=A0A5N0UIL2_9PSEU|nr:hypothetical protein [Amycolatopsis acidicola]KAA9147622.1 hypothetical protein FPZ12_045340 [Amycolatopsis acidicola]